MRIKKTLILTYRQIQRLIDMPSVLEVIENAFMLYGKNLVQMPAKIYLHLDKYEGDFRAMPAYIEGMEVCGLKWVNVHPILKGLITKKDIYATLGEVLIGKKKGRKTSKEITIFDSTGLAIQDVAVANLVYKRALKNRIGNWVRIFK